MPITQVEYIFRESHEVILTYGQDILVVPRIGECVLEAHPYTGDGETWRVTDVVHSNLYIKIYFDKVPQ